MPALLALAFVGTLQDVAAPERFAAARATIAALVEAQATPALSLAVMDGGEVVWAEGFGTADRERGARATADTIYRLASISKPFTATALMLLVERGQLDLDAPVNRYLEAPGVVAHRGEVAAITLRRLANHTAGLPTHWSFFYAGTSPPPRAATIARYGFAAWAPGTRTNYSNLAFGILDHVIARTAKTSFRDYLRHELLDPLGLEHTDLGVRPGREGEAAVGYTRQLGRRFVPVVDYSFDHDGASAVRSSARDLMRFARLQIGDGEVDGRRLLQSDTVRAMRERHGTAARSDFGVGWNVGKTRRVLALRHSGGMPGVATACEIYPERGAALCVLTNGDDRDPVQRATLAILDALLGPEPAAAPAAATVPAAATAPAEPAAPAEPTPAPAGAWRGTVVHFDGSLPIELELGGGAAKVTLGATAMREVAARSLSAARLRLSFRAMLHTTPAFHGTPELELELERDGEGWCGVLYAAAEGVFRLPHWVELQPAAAAGAAGEKK